jgi:hypothetical protein
MPRAASAALSPLLRGAQMRHRCGLMVPDEPEPSEPCTRHGSIRPPDLQKRTSANLSPADDFRSTREYGGRPDIQTAAGAEEAGWCIVASLDEHRVRTIRILL